MLSTLSELPLSVVQTFYGVRIGTGDFEPLPNHLPTCDDMDT